MSAEDKMTSAELLREVRADVRTLLDRTAQIPALRERTDLHSENIKDLYEKQDELERDVRRQHSELEIRLRAQENGAAGSRWLTKLGTGVVTAVVMTLVGALIALVVVSKTDKDGVATRSIAAEKH